MPIGTDGHVSIAVSGRSNVVADVFGYYRNGTGGSEFTSLSPTRLLDTRTATGVRTKTLIPANHTIALQITGKAGIPAGVKAVVLNVTVTRPTASGFLTAWADGAPMPGVSNLNWNRGATIPNQVIVPVGADGKVDLHVAGSAAAVVADVFGYYS